MDKLIENLIKHHEKTRKSTEWDDYEAFEYDILQASYKLEDDGDKTDEQRREIDDKKDNRWAEIRVNYSSDAGATRMVNKEFSISERPIIIREELAKRHEKRLKASIRRADCVKSRFIKEMSDVKRQSNLA